MHTLVSWLFLGSGGWLIGALGHKIVFHPGLTSQYGQVYLVLF